MSGNAAGADGRTLMILGAGIYQVPLIERARALGLRTAVVSIPGDYPGIPLADEFVELDTRDYEGILAAARRLGISGICTSGTDVAVRAIGYVCDALGLPGISYDAATRVTDKALMKRALEDAGVPTARFREVRSWEEALEAAREIDYPVMVKAPDSSGSRGISRADDEEGLRRALQAAFSVAHGDHVLVEEFIDAHEIGVDGFVGERGIEAFLPHEKFTYTFGGTTMPVGHRFPFAAAPALMRELRRVMEGAVAALGLSNCPFNADVFVKGDRAWIIEVGGRTGATCIPELMSIYLGRDWYETIIRAALGEQPAIEAPLGVPCMAKLVFSPVDGAITGIDEQGLEALRPKTRGMVLDFPAGHAVHAMRNGTDRIGHLIAATDDEAELDGLIARMRRCIDLDSGNLQELWERA